MITELKRTDFSQTARGADATLTTITEGAPPSGCRHHITDIQASFDAADIQSILLFGMKKVGPMDGTVATVVDLTGDDFTFAGHGLANGDRVIYYNGGGTSITGLTSGTMYFVVGVSGSVFQLSLTSGGAAINISGTQSALGTAQYVVPLCKEFIVHNQIAMFFPNPLCCAANIPAYLQCTPGAGNQVSLNMSGYTRS